MKGTRKRLSVAFATVGVTLLLALAPGAGVALAGSPNDTQYNNPSAKEQTKVPTVTKGGTLGTTGTVAAPKPTGTLPFTGQDLVIMAGLGGLFVLAGLGLRVAVRARRNS